ncbi:cytoskeleton-associated protein 5 isoform X2 [Macrobrachium rosenbergii]|uniref:cytoskeleton-associated protein 5 isoform X2 n=1 Tax=Macrobrachium rosenbergii TaxID=79674 RepID=UPI0034D54AB5
MEEDTEYLKLPLEERCVHKLWKARLNGYEECTKHFPKIVDEKSPEFAKFAPLMKKFVTDSNAVAQEKALDAVLAFVENAHVAGRTAGEVTAGIVQKCLAAPKRGTQEKALEVVLMYCEIEKYEVVQEELMKGFTQKNPKVVAASVRAVATALREFGPKVINPKPLMKQMHTLLEDRDKNVREESKKLVIELYRWIRQALKPQMSSLKPIQIQELEAEFEKIGNDKVVQTRFLRSQQELKAKMEAQGDEEEEEGEEEEEEASEIDVYDLMVPVDILSQLPKDFYEKIEAKKWQERKEAVDLLLPLTQNPKLETGDYHELMKVLKKIIGKDTNVMIVAQAGLCVAGLAKGMKKKFTPFALSFTETILEKFKEKKTNVVSALREAIDAIYQTTSLESIQETVCSALNNKNPQVKAETAGFLGRAFCYCTPTILSKKLLKAFTTDLLKTLNESDANVREQSAVALGTALKVVGEKVMMVFIADVDILKMQKIKEASEKVEMKVKIAAPKTKKAPAKKEAKSESSTSGSAPAVVRGGSRPAPAGGAAKGKKPGGKGGGGGGGGGGSGGGVAADECQELEMSTEEALEKAAEVLPEEVVSGLTDPNWKTRLESMETFNSTVQGLSRDDIPAQALVLTLAQKPGFKDNNFQVLKLKLEALKIIAENSNFTRRSGEICIQELVEKLADSKNGPLCGEVLIAVAEAATLQWTGSEVMNRAFEQKNPKIQEVALKWMSDAILEFGFVLQPMALIGDIKKALAHTNPGVRTAGVSLCGTIFLYMGAALRVFFVDEKPALLQQIDDEFEKRSGESPPAPIRGVKQAGNTDNEGENEPDSVDTGQPAINAQDMVPRVNISEQLSSNLFAELADKNWKVRNEALQKISNILSDAKFIKGDIGELPAALCSKMNDSNKNIAVEALRITSLLATALGPNCKPHTRTIVPGMLTALGDSKQNIRQQALSTLNSWVEQTGIKETIDGEVFSDALKSGSPFLKAELFIWMAEKLKDAPPKSVNKEELHGCTPYLFNALEDRNADVRKGANEAVLPFMLHLGYEGMCKHTSQIKPSSKNTVMQVLEKAKGSLPARPQPKAKAAPVGAGRVGGAGERQGTTLSGGAGAGRGAGAGLKKGVRAPSATRTGAGRKDLEDVDTSPLVQVNNLKQQRASDEQRLRVLRWDFATPRQEFITQLKDQMTASGMNKQLMANMFHQDFKFHIKAIDALSEDLNSNLPACIANLDLVLKWLTIRFFDTNPSVIIKAMDYLKQVFQLVSEEDYHLMDFEAYSFLPFLITKFGDPKDSIRGSARNIAKLICTIYPASKVSPYMMEGLKAKNARQRAECLEALGSLIEVYGMSVCQPSPGAALKEVAKQIADRDNSVRNASLNVLVQVYFREGEKVFKLVGNLSDKDMCLLEERIKRAAKNRPVIKKPPAEPEVPTVRGGAPAAAGRANRVIPTLAQPAPALVRNREGADGAAGGEQNSFLKRRLARNPSWSSDSVDQSQEDLSWSPPVCHRLPKGSSVAPVSSSISSLSSMSNISSLGSINNLGGSEGGIKSSSDYQLKGDWPLPPLRRRPVTSATLEQARRISRSLSFVLGEPDLEPLDEESSQSPSKGPPHVLPPLSPHIPPPLLTRTVTSPHFTGYGFKTQPRAANAEADGPFKIDYSLIEKLLEDNEPEDKPQYNLVEVPDLSALLNYKPVCPTPASRISRPGFGFGARPTVPSATQPDTEGAAQAINMVISQVGTPDANTVITALSQLDEVLQSEERSGQLAPHIDQLLIVATIQYRLVLNTKMATPTVNKEECIKIYRSLTNCVMMIFNNKSLGTRATRDVLKDVVHVLINILLDPRLAQLEDGPQIMRAINVLVVRIVEKAQFTNVFSALLKLLHESVGSGGNCKFTELVMKCNWKVIRILPSRTSDLDLDQILLDVHNFLMAYPLSSWADRPSDTPLRTIKTVIHTLCKTYGTTILSHFSKIENAHGSELHKYLSKTLKKPKTDDDGGAGDSNRLAAAQVTTDSQDSVKSPKRLSKTAHNTLSEIFRKIGSKENTKEGLIQLYDFKQKHPEADIEPFLKKSSQFFQNYIERGLKRVEMDRQAEGKLVSMSATENGSNAGPLASIQVQDTTNFNMNDVIDQFKSIAARAGFDNTYIDSAVKDICSTEKNGSGDLSEYIKTMSSELVEQNKE